MSHAPRVMSASSDQSLLTFQPPTLLLHDAVMPQNSDAELHKPREAILEGLSLLKSSLKESFTIVAKFSVKVLVTGDAAMPERCDVAMHRQKQIVLGLSFKTIVFISENISLGGLSKVIDVLPSRATFDVSLSNKATIDVSLSNKATVNISLSNKATINVSDTVMV